MSNAATITPLYSTKQLYVRDGSQFRQAHSHEIIARAESLILQQYRKGEPVLDRPRRTAAFLRVHVGSRDHQIFGILHLDADARLIEAENLFRGTLDTISVYPREILKSVLAHRSASVIFYQNYPSGASEVRHSDVLFAYRMQHLLSVLGTTVRDHMIVGKRILSLASCRYL